MSATGKPTGRPTTYTPEIALALCTALAEGESLRAFCQKEGNPSYSTVFQWIAAQPEFADNYRRARELQAHNDGDRMNEVIAQVASGELKPDQGRVMIQGLMWTAGRRLPKVYGEKLQVGGDADGAPLVIAWAGDKG